MCSVSAWKALKRYFRKSEAACQENHGGSLAGAFDLICRSAVMLWHFRHHSSYGQTNQPASPFSLTVLSPATLPLECGRFHNGDLWDARCKLPTNECLSFVFLCFLFSLFSSSSPWSSMYSNVGVWRLPSPPPIYEMCGLNRFATNYTYFTSA